MFIHVGFVLTSVYVVSCVCSFNHSYNRCSDYIFAALGLYASAYIYRVLRTIYNSGLSLKAHISVIPSGSSAKLVQIRIPVPSRVNWSPGQHVFLRFWGLGVPHAFSSHPWTITSLPADGSDAEGERSVDIVLRVHGGITRELARRAEDKAQTSVAVWVDGPYGGLPGGLDDYDSVLLLAGGSGQ
jgi:predicted ferric reductase